MNKKSHAILNIGSSFFLVIFVVLSLVTFATLSVVSANADYQLTHNLENRTAAYYTASNEAETILNTIDHQLIKLYSTAPTETEYFNQCQQQWNQTDGGVNFDPTAKSITYTCSITADQELSVVLKILYPRVTGQSFYKINAWQVINNSVWEPDTTLNVLQIN